MFEGENVRKGKISRKILYYKNNTDSGKILVGIVSFKGPKSLLLKSMLEV